MRILHTADWHIRDKNLNEIERCLNFLVETAKKENPDLIVHAGDIFNSRQVRMESPSSKLAFKIFSELGEIAPVVIIAGTASHEGTATEVLSFIKSRYQVWCSCSPEQIYLCDGELSLDSSFPTAPMDAIVEAVVSLVPAPTKEFFKTESGIAGSDSEIANEMSILFAGFAAQAEAYDAPHILVGHWQVDGAMVSETQTLLGIDISLSKDQISMTNADLTCLGHLHLRQELAPNLFYSGSITGLNYGELEDKGFYIYNIRMDMGNSNKPQWSIESRFVKTPSRKLVKIADDLTVDSDIDRVNTHFQPLLPGELTDAYLRLEYKVYQDEVKKIDAQKIKDHYLSEGASAVEIKLLVMPRENVRSQKILQLTTLREKLVEMAALNNEEVPESILFKADLLESGDPNKVVKGVG